MAAEIIRLEKVKLRLRSRAGEVQILKGIDLSIDEGETVAIVGSSGSGKTSLLMVISGLEQATEGSVKIAGFEFAGASEDRLARIRGANLGVIFQSFHLVPTMTALENAALPLEFSGARDPWGRAKQAIEQVGLAERMDHFPAELSGGEQQRVAIARAIGPRPRLLLADEPTGNLDGRTGNEVMRLLFELVKANGMTLVMVTHDPLIARRCARRVGLADGKVFEDVTLRVAEASAAE